MRNLPQKAAEYFSGARRRATRRKSAWNLLLIPFGLGLCLVSWYGLFRVIWLFHVSIYPGHQLRDFWREDIGFGSFVPSLLMVFGVMPLAVILGLMLANSLLWLIVPLRRVFEAEAQGHPGTSFQASMRGLIKLAMWVAPFCMAIAFLAAYFLKSLR